MSSILKIMLIGIDGRLWNETGVGRYIRNLVLNLSKIDKKNEYILFISAKNLKTIQKQKTVSANRRWKLIVTDIHWHSLREQLQFASVLQKEKLDLMHFPYFSLPILYKKPFIVTIHDLIINHFPTGKASTLPWFLYNIKRFGYKKVLEYGVQNAKKIIVPLNSVKDDLIETTVVDPKKIIVTYEGVDDNIVQKQRESNDRYGKYFLYVGNAYPHKNLERLILAFITFKKKTKEEVKLLLVGKEDYFYSKLEGWVKQENIPDLIFLHSITDPELSDLYSHALALVSPSLMEGFGLTPLEAEATSCIVLVSDISSFREVCLDSVIYFNPYSVEDIAEKMSYVFHLDKTSKQSYIQKGKIRVRNFSWEKMSRQTLAIYESCFGV